MRSVSPKVALWYVLAVVPAFAANTGTNLDTVLKSVENRYNHAQSLRLHFTETYHAQKRATQVESGVLSLRKPGRMRWDYTTPPHKWFLSDGKNLFLYTPDDHKVERSKMKDTEDIRAPLAFLLGRLNFYKEFRSFRLRPEGAANWIEAEPNSNNLQYSRVEFLIGEDSRIRELRIVGQDQSILHFQFEGEQLNPPLNPKIFVFQVPPGAEMVESDQ